MNSKVIIGGIVGAALVVGVGVYFFAGGKGGSGMNAAEAKARADQMLASIKEQGHTPSYQSAEGMGKGVVIKSVTIKPKDGTKSVTEVKIGEILVKDWDWQGGKTPTYGEIEYKKITFGGLAANPEIKEFLAGSGLADIVVNARFAFKYDKASKTLDLSALNGEVEGMGTIGLSLKIEGLDVEALQAMQGAATPDLSKLMGQAMALKVHGLVNFLKDSGGYDRIAKFAGGKANVTADQWKEQQLRQLEGIKRRSPPSKISTEAFAAIEAFLKKPGTVEIKIAPKSPVVMAELMGLAQGGPTPEKLDALKERLGLTISYK
jgi:hypothetical protein